MDISFEVPVDRAYIRAVVRASLRWRLVLFRVLGPLMLVCGVFSLVTSQEVDYTVVFLTVMGVFVFFVPTLIGWVSWRQVAKMPRQPCSTGLPSNPWTRRRLWAACSGRGQRSVRRRSAGRC
ncbi:hypothetical protein [Fodinicola feengrottensis]|uniref:hypothetical protein n=1 Tax=Fodinicola feengrottensis TaxID=435914 RepID=UPI0013D76649|nr:hypothetical protein [Fodinicola feengrottensis]